MDRTPIKIIINSKPSDKKQLFELIESIKKEYDRNHTLSFEITIQF